MLSSSPRDNWARLVEAVVKREQIRQLCHQDSITTATSSSFRSEEVLSVSSSRSKRISLSPPRQRPFTTASGTESRKNARTITWKLFSALQRRMKLKDNHLDDIPALEASRFASKASNSLATSNMSIFSNSSESLRTPRSAEILPSPHVKAFSFNELKSATRNFRPDSFLGEGRYGYVFNGWIDEHSLTAARPGYGLAVAVKKLKSEVCQGHKEWLTEVNYLGQLHHPNLVNLIGYCSDGDNRLLVNEYVPKGSLDDHLFRRELQPLSWATRLKVAIGAARGLSFLHEPEQQIIYRDFKASNILLDGEFNSKLSDFGLADWSLTATQDTRPHGYVAPEYVATDRLTAKSDVYSFGVVLLELLSGRRAVGTTKVGVEKNLVVWAMSYRKVGVENLVDGAMPYRNDKRRLLRIMDIKLGGQYPQKAAFTAAAIAVLCLNPEPKLRPSMAEVLLKLEKLQAPKSASTRHSKADNQVDDMPMLRTKHHSSMNRMPLASPVPAYRRWVYA